MNQNLKNAIGLINNMISKPGMYLINRVEDLHYFIHGYTLASSDEAIEEFFVKFRDFINNKFDDNGTSSWYRIIRFNSSTDIHSISLFKQYFEEFLKTYYQQYSII